MKNKADREYVILFVIALLFSVVVPILINSATSYATRNDYELFGVHTWGVTGYKIFSTVMKEIRSAAPSIAWASILIVAFRYTLIWYITSFFSRMVYSIITLVTNALYSFTSIRSTGISNMGTTITFSFIINAISGSS